MFLEINDTVSRTCFLQLINELAGVFIHHLVKVLQDVEVKRWGDHLAMLVPFAAIAR